MVEHELLLEVAERLLGWKNEDLMGLGADSMVRDILTHYAVSGLRPSGFIGAVIDALEKQGWEHEHDGDWWSFYKAGPQRDDVRSITESVGHTSENRDKSILLCARDILNGKTQIDWP